MTTRSNETPLIFDPRWILFHGNGLLAVNKPAGVPVHAGTGHAEGLAEKIDAWVHFHPGVLDIRAGKPVFPVQHLDLEASGVVLFALRRPLARKLQEAFDAGVVARRFLAVVAGPVGPVGAIRGTVRSRVHGRFRQVDAELSYRRVCGDERLSLVEVSPGKSRRHLIRALFSEAGRPLAGDSRYGRPKVAQRFLEKFQLRRLLLHSLEVELPQSVLAARKTIVAPLPEGLVRLAEQKGWSDEPAFKELREGLPADPEGGSAPLS